MTDEQRFSFLEQAVKASRTGISIEWMPSVEGEKGGYRFSMYHKLMQPQPTLKQAIDEAIIELCI